MCVVVRTDSETSFVVANYGLYWRLQVYLHIFTGNLRAVLLTQMVQIQ